MGSADTSLAAAHGSEYSALRSEIYSFQAIENQTLSLSIALLAALIGLITKAGDFKNYYGLLLLLVPIPFFCLGMHFGYAQLRIIQVATYLTEDLRPRLTAILGRDDLWRWEFFRRGKDACPCPVRRFADFLSLARWVLFLWPAILPGILLAALARTSITTGHPGTLRVSAWAEILGFLLLAGFACYCAWWIPKKVLSSGNDEGQPEQRNT